MLAIGDQLILWDVIAKTSLVISIVALLSLLFKKRPAAFKHYLWSTAVISSLILPGLIWLMPDLKLTLAWATNLGQDSAAPGLNPTHPLLHSHLLLWLWPMGSIIFLLRYLHGLWHVKQWQQEAQAVNIPQQLDIETLLRELGLKSQPSILMHPDITSPLTWGLRHPVILLPKVAEQWSVEQWRLVLLHELCHIKRRDILWQTLAYLGLSLYWFNPLMWFAYRRLRDEAESACDNAVLAKGSTASSYAQLLLNFSQHGNRQPLTATAMQLRTPFARRIAAILDSSKARQAMSRHLAWGLTGISLTITMMLASVQLSSAESMAESTAASDLLLVEERLYTQPRLIAADTRFVPGLHTLPCADEQHCELVIIRLNPQQTLIFIQDQPQQDLEKHVSLTLKRLSQRLQRLPEGWLETPIMPEPENSTAFDL